MLSKIWVSSRKYKYSEEIITIFAILSVERTIFYRPKDKQVHVDNPKMKFHARKVGYNTTLLKVYESMK
jgi:pre-mRNA-splicing factor ATP-dependent RNA helicase DHX16